jgi:hypothetical protein
MANAENGDNKLLEQFKIANDLKMHEDQICCPS